MSEQENTPDLESADRRAVLKSISKYATFAAGTSVVVLSSAEAVKAAPNSNACGNKNPPPGCP